MNKNEYQCVICKGIFEKGWSDEEAKEELNETFGDYEPEECDLICDDCYNKMMGK